MYRRNAISAALAAGVCLLFASNALALVNGDLKTGSGGTLTFSLTSVVFNPDPSANPSGPQWNAEVAAGTSLTFSSCLSGVLGSAGCLSAPPNSPNESVHMSSIPLSPTAPIPTFMTFAGNGTTHAPLVYSVTGIGPGSSNTNCAGLAPGQSCSLFAGSPMILVSTGFSTTVIVSLQGFANDGTVPSPYLGLVDTTISGMTPDEIQRYFCPSGTCTSADFQSGRTLSSSQSGDFVATSALPPPTTTTGFMTGGGQMANFAASHGFNIGCSPNSVHDNLEVNWPGGNKFKLENITFVDCFMNPSLPLPNPPAADFNSLFLTGTGEFNHQPGATVTLLFTDAGEPGVNDQAMIVVTFNGSVVLNVPLAKLATGNQQAHK